jgi:acetyl-CoA acetyltransferase
MPPSEGADVLGAAGDYHQERPQYGEFMFPKLFARIAQIYGERHGLTDLQLALVAVKNRAHARLNPLAQMRDSALSLKEACTESEANPRFAPHLKLTDCSQITDGGAGLILCSARFLKTLPRRAAVRLLGYGHTTDCLPLEKACHSIARKAAERAYVMAGVNPRDIQAAEVHDCDIGDRCLAKSSAARVEAPNSWRPERRCCPACAPRSLLECPVRAAGQPWGRTNG